MLFLEHNLGRHGVVGAVGFIHSEFFFLLFRIEASDSPQNTIARLSTHWKHNGNAAFSTRSLLRNTDRLTFSVNWMPHRWSCQGSSAVLSTLMRNLR